MKIFGLTLFEQKAVPANGTLLPVNSRAGWFGSVLESFTGAWQRNVEVKLDTVLTYSTVFRCISLISSDVSKMRMKLVELTDGIWNETSSPSFTPVLTKPNRYQNRIQFFASWIISKLAWGNAYILLERDARKVVVRMYVLDPTMVTPLVAPDGAVYYQLKRDDLAGIPADAVAVPASEIIHDRWNTLFHPLVGLSPIYACGISAIQGLKIKNNSAVFFGNGSQPGGVLTAPGAIGDDTAARLKAHWEANYSGANVGKVAVLGDGLKFEAMAMKAVDAQLIEQLKWTAEDVCSCFGVPAYMAGVGAAPLNNNVAALSQQYYSQCLQVHIESIELCLDEALGLPVVQGHIYGAEFELDDLIRMDAATQIEALAKAVGGSIMTPNAALKKMNQRPVAGGDTIYMQQQNYSLAALNKRDASDDPFGTKSSAPPAAPMPAANDEDIDPEAAKQLAAWMMQKSLDAQPPLKLAA